MELCELLNEFNVEEKWQRYIFTEGRLRFQFGDSERNMDRLCLDCFEFKRFLKFCKNSHINVDINEMLHGIVSSWDDSKYEYLQKIKK